MAQASDTEKEIHALILMGDDLAFAKLCDAYYEPVIEKIKNFNRGINAEEETLVVDVVTDSFIKYFKDPGRYNPEKQTLEKFLLMDAEGDLKNAWDKLKRKNKKSVELEEKNRNRLIEDGTLDPQEQIIQQETEAFIENRLKELFKDETDVMVAQLMLSGERRSLEYAKILGIEHLSEEAQRLEIKKQKDRIDKTIKRRFRE